MLRCKDPSVKNVEMAMESFGDELGAAGESFPVEVGGFEIPFI